MTPITLPIPAMGLCPTCGLSPVHQMSGGLAWYCVECGKLVGVERDDAVVELLKLYRDVMKGVEGR